MSKESNEKERIHVWIKRIQSFFLRPARGHPFAALRIGLCFVLLIQAYYLSEARHDFYASDGILQRTTAFELGLNPIPNIDWIMNAAGAADVPPRTAIDLFTYSYATSLVFLALGLFTQVASIAAWFLHWVLNNTSLHTRYGIDIYAHIFLFYLMLSPSGKYWSIDAWRRKITPLPTSKERVILRIMQLHLCVSYSVTGLLKAQGEQWWNGELIWRALTLPIYQQWDMTWLSQWPFLLMFAGWMTLFFEIGYAVFIWPRQTRWLWIMAMLGLHLGIAVFLGLHLFGYIMCVLTFSLFALSAEPDEFWAYSGVRNEVKARSLVIFDGDCTLCNRWVRFVRSRDPIRRFVFIPLSSVQARKVLDLFRREDAVESSTIYLVQDSHIYDRSSAILRISRWLDGPWPALFLLLIIPRRLRDLVYRLVAHYRFQLFGVDVCPLQADSDDSMITEASSFRNVVRSQKNNPFLTRS
jgi:predicted DCC family thiol-disulfide oxidoreductase YuxK